MQSGQRVLIHGGAGGVGHFAVQFAKARGAAHIATTVSADDIGFVRILGADQAIDYRLQRFEEEVHDIDLILDLIAGETQERSWSVLKRGGVLVSTLTAPSEEKAKQHGVRGTRFMAQPNGAQLSEIARLIAAGQVRPHVAETLRLDQVGEAQERLEKSHLRGKLVLVLQ